MHGKFISDLHIHNREGREEGLGTGLHYSSCTAT